MTMAKLQPLSFLRWALVAVLGSAWALSAEGGAPASEEAALEAMVRADWLLQEQRLGRSAHSPEAIRAVLDRSRRLIRDLHGAGRLADAAASLAVLDQMDRRARALAPGDEAAGLDLYFDLRAFTRRCALANPLVASHPILFMERRRAVGYMLYEYLGWYYAHGNDPTSGYKNPRFPTPEPGGGVFLLEHPGRTLRARELTAGRLPPGHFMTLSLAPDAATIYFAFADAAGADPYTRPGFHREPGAASGNWHTFHIFAMDADGSRLRRLTEGPYDDFDPCPLPDGGIAFMSTRRGTKLRCGGGSPETVFTLHRMEADGAGVRALSFHETHEWHPSVLHDGRILYTRWDYVDRNAAKFHGLWTCNVDGTNPAALFGNYTIRPWACYQARAIPGSDRIVFVAGAHHANVGGALVVFDPARRGYDPDTGEDRPDALEKLTPEIC